MQRDHIAITGRYSNDYKEKILKLLLKHTGSYGTSSGIVIVKNEKDIQLYSKFFAPCFIHTAFGDIIDKIKCRHHILTDKLNQIKDTNTKKEFFNKYHVVVILDDMMDDKLKNDIYDLNFHGTTCFYFGHDSVESINPPLDLPRFDFIFVLDEMMDTDNRIKINVINSKGVKSVLYIDNNLYESYDMFGSNTFKSFGKSQSK